ncbi:hypothetical protein BWD42_11835 [Sphingobacterium sp. CZ-UAM]|uniref:SusC/RagA family TonB-linked outer membrane protein n=1 Tax=Sphingobacterium sp. CZ-UAM TaxID=1933868 RepID=UPI0009853EF2|nr:SusC/RagA family TonB-linked outer membrane protein [Sphingobacterium sp. CZ-UAM]OOG17982.1 hypothetical protein BWD42_11835 [Sphingobacterium sp. CZ-UAM]
MKLINCGRRKSTSHTWKVSKLTFALLTVVFLEVNAQGIAQSKVTYSGKKVKLETVFREIKKQSGMSFFYNLSDLENKLLASVDLKNIPLEEALKIVLKDQNLTFSINGRTVFIKEKSKEANEKPKETKGLNSSLFIDTKGRITNEAGEPVLASVVVKGTKKGTPTNKDGYFTLQGVDDDATLVISAGNIETLEVKVNGQKNLSIVGVKTKINSLDEVQVAVVSTGYQELIKDRTGGSATTIKDVDKTPFTSITSMLAGKVAGMDAITTNGAPGAAADIRIRGSNSISGNLEPLWVVDGLPLQSGVMSIQGINSGNIQQSILDHGIGALAPTDIESITVLRDAASTAIYGSRAANGVIVIKTKSGTAGKVVVNYQGNFAVSSAPKMKAFNFMNAEQKVDHELALAEQFNLSSELGQPAWLRSDWKKGLISTEDYRARIQELKNVNTNWFDEIYRVGFNQNHNLSLRGGSDKLSFYGSMGITNQKGALISNQYNQYNISSKIGYRPHKNVTVNFTIRGSYRESKNHSSEVDPFKYAVFANPYEKAYNDDGSYAWDQTWLSLNKSHLNHNSNEYNTFNIIRELKESYKKDIASDLSSQLDLTWRITPELKGEVYGSFTYSTLNNETGASPNTYASYINFPFATAFAPPYEVPAEYNKGYLKSGFGRSPAYSLRAGFDYKKDISNLHFFDVYLGAEITDKRNWNSSFKLPMYDFNNNLGGFPDFPWNPILNSGLTQNIGSLSSYLYGGQDRTGSLFGAFSYTYDDRYVINANLRFDGSSTIDPKNRFVPLWSVSGRWNLHNEKFIKNWIPDFVSEFAFRGVYGFTGNINKSALPYAYIRLTNRSYDNEYTAGMVSYPNPSIKWEKKEERSVGLDFSFFRNRFGGMINYYNNVTHDVLGDVFNLPNSYGVPHLAMNIHSIKNEGVELNLNFRVKFKKDLLWIASFNAARNTNRILSGPYPSPLDWNDPSNSTRNIFGGIPSATNIQGYPLGTIFGYQYAGVNPSTGNVEVVLSEESRNMYAEVKNIPIDEVPTVWGLNVNPGGFTDYRTQWLNRSMVKLGSSSPSYTGGFTSTFNWKKLELRTSFSYAVGHLIRKFDERDFTISNSPGQAAGIYTSRLNRRMDVLNRWLVPGDITNVPAITTNEDAYTYYLTSDKFQKGDYLDLREIALTYNLNKSFVRKIGAQSAQIGLQAQNLFVLTGAEAVDVTTRNAFGYPRTKMYLLNLLLSF